MADEFKGVAIALLRAKSLCKCTKFLAQDLLTTLELSLSRRKTRSRPSSTKHLELSNVFSIQLARGRFTAKDVWKTLKDQLERQECYIKMYLLTLLYTTNLEEESLDVDGNVKSMEAIWRRLNDVNLKLPEELFVLMTLMGISPSFGTQRRILES